MIHFTDISKQYGSHVLYKNASFQVRPGDKIGLVGLRCTGRCFTLNSFENRVYDVELEIDEKTIFSIKVTLVRRHRVSFLLGVV